jgi:hypothetical protein
MYRACFKRVLTDKLHHLLNSSAAVCTEYILCASDLSPESVPAAYSESIKTFIQIITFAFPLLPLAGAASSWARLGQRIGRLPRRPRLPPPQRGRAAAALDPAAEPKERRKDATCASGPDYFNMVS